MKKNRIILLVIILLVLIAMAATLLLFKKSDSTNPKGTELINNSATREESDIKIITFAVPNICRIDEENLQKFNEELVNDGHNYMLEIKYLEYEEYDELLKDELSSGDTDIAFLGLGDASGNNKTYNLVNSGLVLNLDELLSQEMGAALYNAFPHNLWESVKCNGHIYSIPSVLVNDQGIYVAFNKDYITGDEIDKWDGSIEGIYEIIKNVDWNDSNAPRLQYLISGYSFEDMINCEIRYGLLFDYDSMSIENPLESDKFIGYLKILEQMKKDGYMNASLSYFDNSGSNNEQVLENIELGNYLVALSSGAVDEVFLKDNIAVKRVGPYLSSRINGSIGISNNADDIDTVLDFLGLFYGDEKYGNILLYGQKDLDYKVIDGVAYNMDGTDLNDEYITKLCFNLYVNIYPVSGESYMYNRRNEIFSFYDNIKLSPFIGFEPDTANLNSVSIDMNGFMNSLQDKSLDETIMSAREKLRSDGIDEYLNGIKSQWEEFSDDT